MKKSIKNATILNVYRTLDKAKSGKCAQTVRRALFSAMYPMKSVAEECEDYEREAAKRLRPDNYRSIVEVVNEFNGMTASERKEAVKQSKYMDALKANFALNRELNECVNEHLDKESEVDFTPLTDEVFDALCESNPDWTLGQCIELQEVLCEKGGEA